MPLPFPPGNLRPIAVALAWLAVCVTGCLGEPALDPIPAGDDEGAEVTEMARFSVTGERLEDFGFRVSPARDPVRSRALWPAVSPVVDVLLPNTAASKAGLRPGDRIVAADGKSTVTRTFSAAKWAALQEAKWQEVAAGNPRVTWTLEVETAVTGEMRTLTLVVPTPAPHWGDAVWQTPRERIPATVPEPGPLAERARQVLDHGIWIILRESYVDGLALRSPGTPPYLLCFQWTLWDGATGHRIYVGQFRGRTDIILETITREYARSRGSAVAPSGAPTKSLESATTSFASASRVFLTSPSGALERAWTLPARQEIAPEEAREEFERELDFWLRRVGRVSPRWPLEVVAQQPSQEGTDATLAQVETTAEPGNTTAGSDSGPRAAAFLQLPVASAAQRALFEEALAKLGADEDRWAYTEASRRPGEKHTVVRRVDPSRPPAGRAVLLAVDGRPPTAADRKRWREQGGAAAGGWDGLPPLGELLDPADLRVQAVESAAVVFELALRTPPADFPAEKFQALLRVNTTQRAFEDIVVRLREPMRLSKLAKVTEAGLTVRFQTLDPAWAPQPVLLRCGGAVRVLLAKVGEEFEATRTQFERVEPWRAPAVPAVPAESPED